MKQSASISLLPWSGLLTAVEFVEIKSGLVNKNVQLF
jgi:hypothetical protein